MLSSYRKGSSTYASGRLYVQHKGLQFNTFLELILPTQINATVNYVSIFELISLNKSKNVKMTMILSLLQYTAAYVSMLAV